MKVWIDDTHQPPDEYIWCKNIDEVKELICDNEFHNCLADLGEKYYPLITINKTDAIDIEIIDIQYGILNFADFFVWLKLTNRKYKIIIHKFENND